MELYVVFEDESIQDAMANGTPYKTMNEAMAGAKELAMGDGEFIKYVIVDQNLKVVFKGEA